MFDIKNFKPQVKARFLQDLETIDMGDFDDFDHLHDFSVTALYGICTEHLPTKPIDNETAMFILTSMPQLLDVESPGCTLRDSITRALRLTTTDQLHLEMKTVLLEKFDNKAPAPRI